MNKEEELCAFRMGILSCVQSFGALPLGLHLSLAVERKGGMTTKCSLITDVWCSQKAHITCAWWIGCIMHSSNDCSPLLTSAAVWTIRRCEQPLGIAFASFSSRTSGVDSESRLTGTKQSISYSFYGFLIMNVVKRPKQPRQMAAQPVPPLHGCPS